MFETKLPALVVLMTCIFLLVSGCSIGSGCEETEVSSSVSSDGKTIATATVANCGATTPFYTYVSNRTSDVPIRDDGVLFGYRGKPDLKITWLAPKDLRIECAGQCAESKVYRKVVKEGQYTIRYSGFST